METQRTTLSKHIAPPRDPRRWLMLAVVQCASLMAILDGFIVNVAVPSIEQQLHSSFAEIQLVVAGYTLAYAVLLITGGRLGDMYGRKRLFLLGVAGFTLCSALCGLAPYAWLLIIFRIAQGITAALMSPQVISFIQVSFDADERPLAFGSYTAVAGLGSVLGQVFGGFLLTANLFNLGWRSIFLVNVPIGIATLLAAWPLLHETRFQKETRRLDYGGVALLTLTLFLLVFPLIVGGKAGWPWWAALSLPCLVAFLAHERRITKQDKAPLVELSLFRQRRFPAGLLTVALANALYGAATFLLAFYLQTILHLKPLQAGLVFLPTSVSFILASSLSSVLHRLVGKHTLLVAVVLVTLSDLLMLLSAHIFVPLWGMTPLLVALIVSGLGMGSLSAPLLNKTLAGVSHADAGTASGVYTTASQMAAALGVTLIGLLFSAETSSTGEPLLAFVISMLVITLLSLSLWLTIQPLSRQTEKPIE